MKFNDSSVQSHMTMGFITVEPDASLSEILQTITEAVAPCLIVIEDDKPVGIITESDLVAVLATSQLGGKGIADMQAKEVMTSSPVTVDYSSPLKEAFVISQSHNLRDLPVVDPDGYLMGLISQNDILDAHFNMLDELQTLSMEDSLLGIGNRRAMEMDLQYTHNNALRYQRYYSIVLLDVDYFKKYNDHYGHQEGDRVLRLVSDTVQGSLRSSDRLYRYGGEELLVLLPETYPLVAAKVVERVLKNLEEKAEPHCESDYGVLTASAGIGSYEPGCGQEWKALLELADAQLYASKQRGRNCVSWQGDKDSMAAEAV
ncbi:GGDEF domain-containing protein [Pseudoteredinibacter isoporae]|uniref:GGDEF domain-containing protein n=1 Tax=Pseudoteredinibacter isoporae TaxID=570281 RepID=UPI00310C6E71